MIIVNKRIDSAEQEDYGDGAFPAGRSEIWTLDNSFPSVVAQVG